MGRTRAQCSKNPRRFGLGAWCSQDRGVQVYIWYIYLVTTQCTTSRKGATSMTMGRGGFIQGLVAGLREQGA